jgi:hypothetical protein
MSFRFLDLSHSNCKLQTSKTMTVFSSVLAFASHPAASSISRTSSTLFTSPAMASSTALQAGSVFQGAALGFFGGVRIPASLIAGTSLGALFSMTDRARNPEGLNKLVVRIYHSAAFCSLYLSLLAIVMCTTGSTLVLLQKYDTGKTHIDVYHFLRSCFNLEFILTRFTFLVSINTLLVTIMTRILLEFDLLKPKNRKAGVAVTCLMASMITSLISYINSTLNCWPNLLAMGKEIIEVRFALWTVFCFITNSHSLLSDNFGSSPHPEVSDAVV